MKQQEKNNIEENDVAIKIENLTKEYKMFRGRKDRLVETIFPACKRHEVFTAVNNLNLEIKKGEILGILGENGAGKSTLLKMITGVVTPTSGNIEIHGKISSLLELGAAFNSELTGEENIYQHGEVMGLTREEIEAKKPEIIEFADIGEHLYQPVKTYSSGMFARLAFACSINVNPDILIVDEVLSVGDMAFQEKSITKMKEIRKKGTTILYVSHSLPSVKHFCTRAIWMHSGKLVLDGETEFVTEEYKKRMIDKPREKQIEEEKERLKEDKKKKKIEKSIEIKSTTCNKEEYNLFEDIEIEVELENKKNIENYGVGILISNSKGDIVSAINSVRIDKYFDSEKTKKVKFLIKRNCFTEDKYYVTVSVCDEKIMFSYDKADYITNFTVKLPRNSFGVHYVEGYYACDYEIIENEGE